MNFLMSSFQSSGADFFDSESPNTIMFLLFCLSFSSLSLFFSDFTIASSTVLFFHCISYISPCMIHFFDYFPTFCTLLIFLPISSSFSAILSIPLFRLYSTNFFQYLNFLVVCVLFAFIL